MCESESGQIKGSLTGQIISHQLFCQGSKSVKSSFSFVCGGTSSRVLAVLPLMLLVLLQGPEEDENNGHEAFIVYTATTVYDV